MTHDRLPVVAEEAIDIVAARLAKIDQLPAPAAYVRVVAVTGANAGLALGTGEHMRALDRLLTRYAIRGLGQAARDIGREDITGRALAVPVDGAVCVLRLAVTAVLAWPYDAT